tara:strand:+ start:169 stop:345 length:177 start_codon:yes stop_codon:yes gene_type:complete
MALVAVGLQDGQDLVFEEVGIALSLGSKAEDQAARCQIVKESHSGETIILCGTIASPG